MIKLRNCGLRSVKHFEFGRNLDRLYLQRVLISRVYQDDSKNRSKENGKKQCINMSEQIPSAISSKYQVFRDEDASVILDVEEERLQHLQTLELPQEQDKGDEFSDLNFERKCPFILPVKNIPTMNLYYCIRCYVVRISPHWKLEFKVCYTQSSSAV
jgi:hypothetical protein